jgi:DNA invertase Pin-like site-specific DNA recombinase
MGAPVARSNLASADTCTTPPTRPVALQCPAMVAEFEADLIRARTREGMAVAKAKGKLR